MLRSFSAEETAGHVVEDGRITVTCEFCCTRYDFDPAEVEAEVAPPEASSP